MAKKRREPRRIHPPTREEVDAIAGAMRDNTGGLVLTAAWSGLRLSEVCSLEKRDVTDCGDFARIVVRLGKGAHGSGPKQRQAILLAPGFAAVKAEPGWTFGPPTMPLFKRPQNQWGADKWERKIIWKALTDARRAVGLEHVIFHDFRKFYATHLLNSGVSPMDVAVALGHLDRNGQPDTDLVRRVYGFVNHDQALERAVEVANVCSTGEVTRAADVGVAQGERDQVGAGSVEGQDQGGGGAYRFRARAAGAAADPRDDEGVGGVARDAEGRAGEGEQDARQGQGVAVEDVGRPVFSAAQRARLLATARGL